MFPCSACKSFAYCGRECQLKAWKTGHKVECPQHQGKKNEAGAKNTSSSSTNPFDDFGPYCKLTKIKNKGLGVVATQFVPAGTVLVREEALLSMDSSIGQGNRKLLYSKVYPLLAKQYQKLSKDEKLAYNALKDSETSSPLMMQMRNMQRGLGVLDKSDEQLFTFVDSCPAPEKNISSKKSVQGIFCTNSIGGGCGENDEYLCLKTSRFNHSCSPNALHTERDEKDEPTKDPYCIIAARDIQEGEEITWAYFDVRKWARARRSQHATMGFKMEQGCKCEMCAVDDHTLGMKSDKNRQKIHALRNKSKKVTL